MESGLLNNWGKQGFYLALSQIKTFPEQEPEREYVS
tara:strand:- start:351 stop:458 length:108 start_codon:yes stop_codon:yes gene_type:complete